MNTYLNSFQQCVIEYGVCPGTTGCAGGIEGAQGFQGFQGNQGFQGARGFQGAQGSAGGTFAPQFAQYYSTVDQTNSGATGNTMTMNVVDFETGISLVSSSRITVSEIGHYTFSFSIQFINPDGQEHYIDIWFEKNGLVIPNSNSRFGILKRQTGLDGLAIISSTIMFDLNAGDYLELRWFCNDINVRMEYVPAGVYLPATPSTIINIHRISL